MLALLRQTRMRCRDELIEMMLRRIRRTQAAAKEQLDAFNEQYRAIEENLIDIFGQLLETEQAQDTDAIFGRQVRKLLSEEGGVAALAQQYETMSARHRGNDLSLLWPIHARHRVLLARLLDLIVAQSATQDHNLLDALAIVSSHRHTRRDDVLCDIDLAFTSQRWQAFVIKHRSEQVTFDRRALEVCVSVHKADVLQSGDLYVAGAETFADYRAQILPWAECEASLPAYCAAFGIPERDDDFAAAVAFRELRRIERTLCLLRFFSSIEIRRVIRAETTKIEAFNDFLDRVSFGGPVINSGAPVEQEKQLKYASLVINTIMLSNVADLTTVLSDIRG